MLVKRGSYLHDQLLFGLLGIRHMFDREIIELAIHEETLGASYKVLESRVSAECKEILEFIYDDLFSTEESTERLRVIYGEMDNLAEVEFLSSYRYHAVDDDGTMYTNGRIEIIVSAILARDKPLRILDIGSGQGVFLSEAISQGIAEEYFGIEISKELAMISKIKMLVLGMNPSQIKIGNIFDENLQKDSVSQYDAVFCHMPMGKKLAKEILVDNGFFDDYNATRLSKRDSEWAFIKAMQRLTKTKGRSIALVRSGILFTEMGKAYRQELIESGRLEAVILLPSNLLNSTSIQTALIVLSSNNKVVKMINASAYYEKGRRINYITDSDVDMILDLYYNGGSIMSHLDNEEPSEEYEEIAYDIIADNDYSFEPKRYLLKGAASFNNPIKLGDVTDRIFRGVQIKADNHNSMMQLSGDEPNCYLLNLSDISNGFIDDSLEEANIDDLKRRMRYMVKQGDVIVSARGTKISVAVADNVEGRDIIATGNLIVIRCSDSLDPYYLKVFLDSDTGRNILESAQTGSAIFAINPKQLKEISIELFDIEKQKMIGQKAKNLVDKLRESHRCIEVVTQELSHLFNESRET